MNSSSRSLLSTAWIALFLGAPSAWARLTVLTTTTDLAHLVAQVGGELVQVESMCKGTQDPHYLEAKPSYMVKASRADLVVAVGLDLEVGYLSSILQGARNPKVRPGAPGYLEVGPRISPIEVAKGAVTRAEGDVHPEGNPHFMLDPLRVGEAAIVVASKLGELDPPNAGRYRAAAETYKAKLESRTKEWSARISKSGVKQVITYHKTLNYFLERFGLAHPIELEPKPGVPPTSGHVLQVIRVIRDKKVPLILVENYFDPSVTGRIRHEAPGVRVADVPVAVEGSPGVDSIEKLIERLVSTVEGK